jgi:hypothetical protein
MALVVLCCGSSALATRARTIQCCSDSDSSPLSYALLSSSSNSSSAECACMWCCCLFIVAAGVDISNIDVLVKIAKSVGVTGAREYLQSTRDEVSITAMCISHQQLLSDTCSGSWAAALIHYYCCHQSCVLWQSAIACCASVYTG